MLDGVTAHGKHLFAAFGDRIVHVHLGLFGKYASGTGDPPEPRGAIRMRWVADSGWSDLRGPTACELLSPSEVDAVHRPPRSRPPARAAATAQAAFDRIRRSRAPLAGLLMDQRVVAGVGNVYRAEVLFRHRLDPYLPGQALDATTWRPSVVRPRDADARRVAVRSHHHDGSRRPVAAASGPVRGEDAHYVYRRTGLPCRIDGTPIIMQPLGRPQALLVPDLPRVGRRVR